MEQDATRINRPAAEDKPLQFREGKASGVSVGLLASFLERKLKSSSCLPKSLFQSVFHPWLNVP